MRAGTGGDGDFGGTPTPLFVLCRGNKGVAGIWTLSRGTKGLRTSRRELNAALLFAFELPPSPPILRKC